MARSTPPEPAPPPADEVLARFSEPTRAWFTSTFDAPTSAQVQGWDAISSGSHTLILAPTGSGKTLAAFLWALDRLHTRPSAQQGVRVLYISPLKALIYDVERNLRSPLLGIAREAVKLGQIMPEVSVGTRTGDTPAQERRALAKHPPEILVTTPESLYLLLTSEARSILTGVEHVVVDEIHAMADTKRGAHLALSLERLSMLCAKSGHADPQRIGLSATQRPLEEVARFLGGREPVNPDDPKSPYRFRPVRIVDTGVRKQLEIEIIVPVDDMGQLGKPALGEDGEPALLGDGGGDGGGDPEARSSIWPAVYPKLLDLIRAHTTTLVFVNSRRLAERVAAKLNELDVMDERPSPESSRSGQPGLIPFTAEGLLGAAGPQRATGRGDLVRAHHGSLAREQRLEIESALKAGLLPALVCTSSLELGIDMGAIDLVVQVESPSSVASGLQRIGRAGHQVGHPSRGKIFPKYRGDLVSAAVVAQRMRDGEIETTKVPRNPVDVLCQQVVAQVVSEPLGLDVAAVARMARGTYNFADIADDVLDGVLDLLSGRYPSDEFADLRPRVTWDRMAATLTPRPGARMVAVANGGTIPDRGLYTVVTPENTKVGELDEEMVFESRVGETFLLGASTWRIEDITPDKVIVTPAPGIPGKMPFWHGDKLGRPIELGRAIGAFVRRLGDDEITDEELRRDHFLDELALRNLRKYIEEEKEATGGLLPTDRQIVVQRYRDELGDWQMCVLSPFGAQVHAPWCMAIEQRVRERLGMEVRAVWTDDGIVVRLPEADESPATDFVLIDPDDLEELLMAEVGSSALFSARFRENASRALLLPKRKPGQRTPLWRQRQRSADLLKVASRYGSFPIILETYRECLRDAFDVPALTTLLQDIRSRKIRVVSLDMAHPSPFASSTAFGYIANFMYDGDAPLAERRAAALALDRDMLSSLLGQEELRELLDPRALIEVEDDLQRVTPMRRARTLEAVHDLLRQLGDLSVEELAERVLVGEGAAAATDVGAAKELASRAAEALVREKRAVVVRLNGADRVVTADDAARYRDGLGVRIPPGLPEALLLPSAPLPILREPSHEEGPLASLLVRYARTHGPFLSSEAASRFGVSVATVEAALAHRVRNGLLLTGQFRPEGAGVQATHEYCDPDVLRRIRQRSLALLRKEIEPTSTDALARFLPEWQGVGGDGGGVDRLYEAIDQLQGVALPASVWERDVFPARMPRYSGRWLDELMAAGEVLWRGAGPLGRDDGRVQFFLRDDAALLAEATIADPDVSGDWPNEPEHWRLREVLAARGACFFRELQGTNDTATLDAVWDLAWAGEVTNDSYACIRAFGPGRKAATSTARGGGSRRMGRPRVGSLSVLGPPKAQGRWTLLARELGRHDEELISRLSAREGDDTTVLAQNKGTRRLVARQRQTERLHARAVALLERHGVLTREAVKGEGIEGGFAGMYPVLKALEDAGRVRRGYFVAGLGGAQFAVPGAVDRLRAYREPDGKVVVLAATDPANAYGLSLPWPVKGPQRAAGAYVVLVDGLPSLYLEKGGRSCVALRPFDSQWEQRAVDAVTAMVGDEDGSGRARFRRLVFERHPPELSALFHRAGFVPTPKGLARYA